MLAASLKAMASPQLHSTTVVLKLFVVADPFKKSSVLRSCLVLIGSHHLSVQVFLILSFYAKFGFANYI